jgi:hypothetical protein
MCRKAIKPQSYQETVTVDWKVESTGTALVSSRLVVDWNGLSRRSRRRAHVSKSDLVILLPGNRRSELAITLAPSCFMNDGRGKDVADLLEMIRNEAVPGIINS